jgi:hypothetical protein
VFVAQQTPLDVTASPPSAVMLPPLIAVLKVMDRILDELRLAIVLVDAGIEGVAGSELFF